MRKFILILIVTLGIIFIPAPSFAYKGDGPALRPKTLFPKCNDDDTTRVRVGVKQEGIKFARHVTVYWKTSDTYSKGVVFAGSGRLILTHNINPDESMEFYVYPTKRPGRILLHDTVSALNCE